MKFGDMHGGGECIEGEIGQQIFVDVGNGTCGNAVVGDEAFRLSGKAVVEQEQDFRADAQRVNAVLLHPGHAVKAGGHEGGVREREVRGQGERELSHQVHQERTVEQHLVPDIVRRDIRGGAVDDAGVDDEHVTGAEDAEIVSDQNSAAAGKDLNDFNGIVVRVLTAGHGIHSALSGEDLIGHFRTSRSLSASAPLLTV